MAVGVIYTDIEGALPSLAGLVVPVEAEVQPVIRRQGVVVWRAVDFILHPILLVPNIGALARETVARMEYPSSVQLEAAVEAVGAGKIDAVTVVVAVRVPGVI